MKLGWISPLAAPFAALFGALVWVRNKAYDRGWLRAKRLSWPVISVGNLSVGGAGKTPVVIRLAQLLAAEGVEVSVLSRGYGRQSSAVELVDPAGTAARFGDEPLLIARCLNSGAAASGRVVVGASRLAAGTLSEASRAAKGETAPPAVHLLDDGFQHRKLFRDIDIVVLHRSDLEARLLPSGRLREPLTSLRRASILVLREEDAELEPRLRRRGLTSPVWFVSRKVKVPSTAGAVVAFCGIARPGEFFDAVRSSGSRVVAERAFGDHHHYSASDIDGLRMQADELDAQSFLTTAKDAVRLDAATTARLVGGQGGKRTIPLLIAELEVTFHDEEVVIASLLRRIAAR